MLHKVGHARRSRKGQVVLSEVALAITTRTRNTRTQVVPHSPKALHDAAAKDAPNCRNRGAVLTMLGLRTEGCSNSCRVP